MQQRIILAAGILALALLSADADENPTRTTSKQSPISTHVLDTRRGRPANGIGVQLAARTDSGTWQELGRGTTDADGRIGDLFPADKTLNRGVYRLTFDVAHYFAAMKQESFYPEVTIVFEIRSPTEHYHVPLLLSPYGYSTYRGS